VEILAEVIRLVPEISAEALSVLQKKKTAAAANRQSGAVSAAVGCAQRWARIHFWLQQRDLKATAVTDLKIVTKAAADRMRS